jgi:DNA-binding NtrC family response regulator
MPVGSILIAEDNRDLGEQLVFFLKETGYAPKLVADGQELVQEFSESAYDLILCDLKMPRMDGMEALKRVKSEDREATVIMVTGYGTISKAVEAIKLGAFDFVEKPIDFQKLSVVIAKAMEHSRLINENKRLRNQLESAFNFDNIVGYSPAMKRVFHLVRKVAPTNSTVLILGESGTGKELIAKAIHYNSERRTRPLVTINCGAIPQELLESELFGYEKGAFTGAVRGRMGRFEIANTGTIFLDEIGDTPLALQVKMLRVLQEKTIERIGGGNVIKVDVRIIAATHQDLEERIRQGAFREDLYYRLNVFPITIPPLRERKSDIPLLANHILEKLRAERGHRIIGTSPEAQEYFMHYDWPGNVREMENIIERAVILKESGMIDLNDLPECDRWSERKGGIPKGGTLSLEGGINLNTAVSEYEKQLILQALNQTNWIKNKAAKLLNLKRTTLVEKMKRINLEKESA